MHNCRPGAGDGSRDPVPRAIRWRAGQAAAGFCYLVNRRGETLASNYRQSNADDGRVIHATPASMPVDRCCLPPGYKKSGKKDALLLRAELSGTLMNEDLCLGPSHPCRISEEKTCQFGRILQSYF